MRRLPARQSLWAAAAVIALAPVLFIAVDRTAPSASQSEAVTPLAIVPAAEQTTDGSRLFGSPSRLPAERAGSDSTPVLLGVIGRIGADAVALVRTRDGAVRTMAVGAVADGWRLGTIAPDAALFTQAERRVRAELPLGDSALPSN